MAKRKKRAREEGAVEGGESAIVPATTRRLEALGVACVLLAIGMFSALVSFDPADAAGARNLVGPVGRGFARAVLTGFGVSGYLVLTFAVIAGGGGLVLRGRWPRPVAAIGTLGVLLGAVLLAQLAGGESGPLGHPAGGALGAVLSTFMRGKVGALGAGLVATGVLFLSVLAVFEISVGGFARESLGALRWVLAQGRGSLEVWKASRDAAKAREEELIAAEQERRASAERTRIEKENKLRESLEEKKRLAVMKAQAKAEEKALAKLAAEETRARIAKEQAEAEARKVAEAGVPGADLGFMMEPEKIELGIPGPAAEPPIEIIAREASEPPSEVAASEPPVEVARVAEAPFDPEHKLGPEIVELHPEGPDPDLLAGDAEPSRPPMPAVEKAKTVYELPPIRLLNYDAPPPRPIDGEALRALSTRLEEKLRTYGVDGRVTAIRPGPVVTTYEYQPAPGVKVAKIASLSDDIAMSMEAKSVRIIAPIPGKGVVGIELPNDSRENVYLKEIIAHDRFQKSKSLLTLALGKDVEGEGQVRDLAKMPHILVAGTTGSGKSVSVNTMILSILYKATPDQVKFIMVDPKMLELSLYDGIPHLLLPVVTDAKKASLALQWAVDEMERRYQMLSDFKVRDIEGFNRKLAALRKQRAASQPPSDADVPPQEDALHDPMKGKDLPEDLAYIVVLIDEFADLMCVAGRDVEQSVQRLAQKARAAGIHVMLATQRPSTDVVTGVIKNNFPCRISFRVASRHDSTTIINMPGAEHLLGMGDMLFLGQTSPTPARIHGAYVSEEEVQRVVDFWKAQGKPSYDPTILRPRKEEGEEGEEEGERDEMYDKAVAIVLETRRASISALQRRLQVGYNRAARMIEVMERDGIVSAPMGAKGEREVIAPPMGADGPPRS